MEGTRGRTAEKSRENSGARPTCPLTVSLHRVPPRCPRKVSPQGVPGLRLFALGFCHQGGEALEGDFAGRLPAALADFGAAAHVNGDSAGIAGLRVACGEARREQLGGLREAIQPVGVTHQDMGSGVAGEVEPEVERLGELGGQEVVLLGGLPDQDGEAVGRDEAPGDPAAAEDPLLGVGGGRGAGPGCRPGGANRSGLVPGTPNGAGP